VLPALARRANGVGRWVVSSWVAMADLRRAVLWVRWDFFLASSSSSSSSSSLGLGMGLLLVLWRRREGRLVGSGMWERTVRPSSRRSCWRLSVSWSRGRVLLVVYYWLRVPLSVTQVRWRVRTP